MTTQRIRTFHSQQGAALVVGLILLVAVTLMALASMNTATLDLMMAANEQYRSRAFYAAETGVEVGFNNQAAFNTNSDFPMTANVSTGAGNDAYRYSVTRPPVGIHLPGQVVPTAPSGNSLGTFGSVYFKMDVTGVSERNAADNVVQEVVEIVRTTGTTGCVITPCAL